MKPITWLSGAVLLADLLSDSFEAAIVHTEDEVVLILRLRGVQSILVAAAERPDEVFIQVDSFDLRIRCGYRLLQVVYRDRTIGILKIIFEDIC